MRRICTLGLSALCLMIFSATPASAMVDMETCQSDADCQDGWTCQMECQDKESGDSEDAQCQGYCTPGGDDSSNNDCESDADCPSGFECTEHSMTPPTTTGIEPIEAEPACPEGEKCDEGEEEAGDDPTDEMPPEQSQPQEEEIWKTCTPKSCETDADCDGNLVCVLTTYECPGAVVVAPAIDCAEGEDCGAPPEEEPKEPADDCEPETVGQCAPKWLAPCQEAADCGAGFECVEEEICWGTSSGGSMGGMPCDPDDEDCGEGFAPPPQEEKEGDDEDPNEGCEPTGELYCELQMIDCSSEACPEGLVCVDVAEEAITEDCAMSSDGEMDCPEPEEELPAQVCVPEGFEDWIGGASSSGVALDGSTTNAEENAPGTSDDDGGAESGASGATSSGGGSSDSGCSGSGSGVPAGTLVLSLLVLALIGRRRA